jgi:hypothetical protein
MANVEASRLKGVKKANSQWCMVSTYFPAAHAEKEAHHIGLLLLLELFDILEGTHFGCFGSKVSNENGQRGQAL